MAEPILDRIKNICIFRAILSTLNSQSCRVINASFRKAGAKSHGYFNGTRMIYCAPEVSPSREVHLVSLINSDLIVFNLPLGCGTSENCTQPFRPLLMRGDAKTNSGHNRQFHFHLVREKRSRDAEGMACAAALSSLSRRLHVRRAESL